MRTGHTGRHGAPTQQRLILAAGADCSNRPRPAKMKIHFAYVASAFMLFASHTRGAEDDPTRLSEIIVTAPGDDGSLRSIPHGVSVITADDIQRSSATSVVDLLSREANLNLRSFYGSDKYGGMDMRGMGDTAGSNVLILVDGVRRNEVDLSGADMSSVPLSQIERIEIVRGGGAVQYGNGAVAGVINIITKRGLPHRSEIDAQITRGSYDLSDARLHARGGAGPMAVSVNLSDYDSNGYRKNSFLHSRNAAAEIRLTSSSGFLESYLRASHHVDRNGFPGPVSAEDFAAGSKARQSTKTPHDFGETQDATYTAGLLADFGRAGRFDVQGSIRDRTNDYVMGFNPLLSKEEQLSTITSKQGNLSLRYDNDIELFGQVHTLSAGLSRLNADYARYSDGRFIPEHSQQKLGDVFNEGTFVSAIVRPLDGLAFNFGIRRDRFSTSMSDEKFSNTCTTTYDTVLVKVPVTTPFGTIYIDVPTKLPVGQVCTPYAYVSTNRRDANWTNTGAEAGASWRANAALTIFGSMTRHFRNPNIDELVLASNDLHPQNGNTLEAGARWKPSRNLELGLTLFRMRIRDEIYYGVDSTGSSAVNRNYDLVTRRIGAEIEARWQASPELSLRTNFGYVKPRFEGVDADVPHVPRVTANLQGEWKFVENGSLSIAARYVGARFDGNDFDNRSEPKLPSYAVVDGALRYQWSSVEVSAGINNLFNKAYTTLGYSGTYYPMPERNFYLRLRMAL